MTTLEIRNLQVSVETDDTAKEILRGVDLTINSGETHAIMGPNGSGKSTLAYAIAGHPKYTVTGGSITLDGEDVYGAGVDPVQVRRLIGMVFQQPNPFPTMSIYDNVASGLNLNAGRMSKSDKDGVWIDSQVEKAPNLTRRAQEPGSDVGRCRVIELQPNTYADCLYNLHQDDNNRLNPDGTGWVVRGFFNLTDDKDSFFVLRENRTDPQGEVRIALPAVDRHDESAAPEPSPQLRHRQAPLRQTRRAVAARPRAARAARQGFVARQAL